MEEIRIWKEDGWYIAEIPALGIVDQARTIKRLRKELKEAIELSVESILKDEIKIRGDKGRALKGLFVDSVLTTLELTTPKAPEKYRKLALAEA